MRPQLSYSVSTASPGRPPRGVHRGRHTALAALVYTLLAIVAFLPVLPFDNSHIVSTLPSDTVAVGWFLAWPAYALEHAHNVLFSNWIDYPTGVNLPVNQSMPLLGLVMTPVTLAFGPIATINVTLRLAMVVSALAMYLALRRFCEKDLASFFGGLLYGFSPFIVAHSSVNQNFSFAPFPPLIFLALYELASGKQQHVLRTGLVLGLLLAAQLYLNPEMTVDAVVVAACTVVVSGAAVLRRADRARVIRFLEGCSVAVLAAGVLSLPFLWYYFAGPQHATNSTTLPFFPSLYHADLAGLVSPGRNQLIGPTSPNATGNLFLTGMTDEIGTYLGVPLLVGLVWFVARHWRERAIAVSAVTFVVALILSLGSNLYFDTRSLGIPLPLRAVENLPIFDRLESVRFFLFVDLAAAVIVAVGLDFVLRQWRPRAFLARYLQPSQARLAGGVLVAAVLLFPLIPRWPYPSEGTDVPRYFTSSAVEHIADGAVVLTYPYTEPNDTDPEVWQLASGFRFRLVGGYAYVANNGGVRFGAPPIHPGTIVSLLQGAYLKYYLGRPPADETTYRAIRAGLREAGVDDFILAMRGADPALVVREMTAALDRRPTSTGGVLVWYDVPRDLATVANSSH
ncbi:MAG TPA: hypothetical protein VED84_00550 [Acidimicrobiales bacterium]|nr:hypothetical protein [Acidimicrobiales bacterium]